MDGNAPAPAKLKRDRSATIKSGPTRNGIPFTAAPIIDHWNVDECLLTLHEKCRINTVCEQSSWRISLKIDFAPTTYTENSTVAPRVSCIFYEVVYPSTEELVYIVTNNNSVIGRPPKRAFTHTRARAREQQ